MGVYIYKEEQEWQPGENTVMYYPFKEDQLDKVGSSSIGITGTKETLGYTFSSNDMMYITNYSTSCRFISTWIKYNSSNGQYTQGPRTYIGNVLYNFYHSNNVWNKKFQYSSSAPSGNEQWPQSDLINTSAGQRYHLAFGTDGSKVYAYVNGVKVWETVPTPGLSNSPLGVGIGRMINETLSDFICESVCWTEQEIVDYYNLTCGYYGLQPIS